MIKPIDDLGVMDHAPADQDSSDDTQSRRDRTSPVNADSASRSKANTAEDNHDGNGNGRTSRGRSRSVTRTLESFGPMVGSSPPMRSLYNAITKVAPTEATVLIIGESGTGKELVAQTIHQLSKRSDGPIVAVNCGAIPETLIESELFGHEKGAFTGATQMRKGVFERAEGGTLFLDEISEMPVELQVKLLRVLETERFTRIGGEGEHVTNLRVIAATNCEPREAVADGKLREDLLYRLSVCPLRVPPLRDRGDDVRLLARHFLTQVRKAEGDDVEDSRVIDTTVERFVGYNWPGNVRELKNIVWRSYIMGDGEGEFTPRPEAVLAGPPNLRKNGDATHDCGGETVRLSVGTALAEAERELIYATLRHFDDNKKRTAQTLGISLKTLYNRLNAYQAERSE